LFTGCPFFVRPLFDNFLSALSCGPCPCEPYPNKFSLLSSSLSSRKRLWIHPSIASTKQQLVSVPCWTLYSHTANLAMCTPLSYSLSNHAHQRAHPHVGGHPRSLLAIAGHPDQSAQAYNIYCMWKRTSEMDTNERCFFSFQLKPTFFLVLFVWTRGYTIRQRFLRFFFSCFST